MALKAVKTQEEKVVISRPDMRIVEVSIKGMAPYVQNKFSNKTQDEMMEKQRAGSTEASKKKREAKDFDAVYQGALHVAAEGWYGIPAAAFRSAMIDSCRLVGFVMARAKLAIFIIHDGVDCEDGTPLVKIEGEPRPIDSPVKNATGGPDIRRRPMWEEWQVKLQVRFDADQFTSTDILNLIARAGMQVGVGEGRPNSKKSHGMGWGLFNLVEDE